MVWREVVARWLHRGVAGWLERMKCRARGLWLGWSLVLLGLLAFWHAPNAAFAEGRTPQHSTAKVKKSTAVKATSSKKSSSQKAKNSSKESHQKSSQSQKAKRSSKGESQAKIAEYRAMAFEAWESPRGTSEMGLAISQGYAQPYPYGNLLRQFDGNHCRHRGLDIGAVGVVNGGIGTVVNSATPGVVTFIGRAGGDVREFGKLDKRSGNVKRTGRVYPRQILVPGYGLVYPFSRTYGRWRSGTVIIIRITDGPLKDHTMRYMHLADVRPDLRVGARIEAGEHIGLMGGTAVMDSWPHVHIDVTDPNGKRIDPAPYIGLLETISHCKAYSKSKKSSASSKTSKSSKKSSAKSSKTHSQTAKMTTKRSRESYVGGAKNGVKKVETRVLSR